MNIRIVLDLLELKNQASQHFAGNQRCPSFWNAFPFLEWDLSMHPRTHILFFNQFICTAACACSSNLIMHINALKTQIMHKNVQTNPEKSQKFTQHSCCSMLTRENFWKQYEATDIVSSLKVARSLLKPSRLLWEDLVCEKHIPKPAPNGIFYHVMLMPLHDSMPSFMNSKRVLDLLEFKNKVSQHFSGNQECPGVWNSFPFLAWDLSMHPRTQIWFFN